MPVVACAPRTAGVKSVRAAHGASFMQVRAILRDSCDHCHDEETAEGSLVLKNYDTLIAGGESGNPIVPGKSASSLLVQAIEGRVKPRMPYKEDPLSEAEIATIRRWIDAGAPAPAAADTELKVEIPDVRPTVPVSGPVSAVAFDVTARRIAVGSYKSVHVLSVDDRKWIQSVDGHADLIRALAFSADGTRLAAAGGASGAVGEVRIWDVQQIPAKAIATIQGHKDAILSVAFSPDGFHHRHRQLRQAREVMGRGHRERASYVQGALGRRVQRRLPARRDAVGLRGRRPDAEDMGRSARYPPHHHLRRARCRLCRGRSPVRHETGGGWRRSA